MIEVSSRRVDADTDVVVLAVTQTGARWQHQLLDLVRVELHQLQMAQQQRSDPHLLFIQIDAVHPRLCPQSIKFINYIRQTSLPHTRYNNNKLW